MNPEQPTMREKYDEALLLEYVEGQPDAAGARRVREWARSDPRLRRLLDKMIADRDMLRMMPDPPRSAVQDLHSHDSSRQWVAGVTMGIAMLAVFCAIGLIAWSVLTSESEIAPDHGGEVLRASVGAVPTRPKPVNENPVATDLDGTEKQETGHAEWNFPDWASWKIDDWEKILSTTFFEAAQHSQKDRHPLTHSLEPDTSGIPVTEESQWSSVIEQLTERPSRARHYLIEIVTTNPTATRSMLGRLSGQPFMERSNPQLLIAPVILRGVVRQLREASMHEAVWLLYPQDPQVRDPLEPDFEDVLLQTLQIKPNRKVEIPVRIRNE